MISFAILLIFLSAILHVTWNVMIQSTEDPLDVATKGLSLGIAALSPIFLIVWILSGSPVIPPEAIFYGFLSGVFELAYFIFLSYSYRHGELSVVYPIARGSAPIFAFFGGYLLLREHVTTLQIVGIIFLITGIWTVRQARFSGWKSALPAVLTGFFIAAYTVADKAGLQYTTPFFFGELKYLFSAVCLLLWIPFRNYFDYPKVSVKNTKKRTSWQKISLIGVFIIVTYQLVLYAMQYAPVSIVSPLRESASIVITAWGIWKLKEREGMRLKLTGVIAIFLGIILLTV